MSRFPSNCPGPEQGSSGPDLFLLNIDAADILPKNMAEEDVWNASLEALEWLDSFVKHLMAHTGTLAVYINAICRPLKCSFCYYHMVPYLP